MRCASRGCGRSSEFWRQNGPPSFQEKRNRHPFSCPMKLSSPDIENTTMQAIIPGKNVRLFAKMISCLQKIGEDLFIEATQNKLILRALNANRSAYFCFNLLPNFFRSYELTNGVDCRYKVLLKACSAVFKGINSVEECAMKFTNDDPKLIFEMNCKMGVKKTYKLNVEDCEPLQAVYSHEHCPHKIISRPKLLIDCIQNFAANIDEITLVLNRQWVRVKSFIDDQKADDIAQKSLLTELNIDPQDFERFDLTADALELTFCLKEMRAILGFCEVATQPISLFMDEPGKPILLNVKLHNAFEADFVLATLLEPATDVSASGESQQQYSQMSGSQPRGKGTQGSSSAHPTGAQRSTLGAASGPSQSSPMSGSAGGSPGLRTPPPLTPAKRRASEIGSEDEPQSKRIKSPEGSAEPLVWGRQLVAGDVDMSEEYDEHSDVPPSP